MKDDYSYISSADSRYVDLLYADYRKAPSSVDLTWQKFFEGFEFALGNGAAVSGGEDLNKELQVYRLIMAYRQRGHLLSTTNPIRQRIDRQPNLDLASYSLSEEDLPTVFGAARRLGMEPTSLENILERLNTIYTGNLGVEYMHIHNVEEHDWLAHRFEERSEAMQFSLDKKERILRKLNQAVVFEKFLHTKYVGQKRFSLEGGENTIPALDAIIQKSASLGAEDIVIGMAHRGRLNVLANTLGKTYEYIFGEFEGNIISDHTMGAGDVKYHLGFSSQIETAEGKSVQLHLAPNPSHLEAVDPVVLGHTRAKMDVLHDKNADRIVPVLIHGDSAVAGQGVVYEVVQMSKLAGYGVGGTIHFVINNQIGFTTDFEDARSADYCTSVARTVDAPVIHVNGDDAEAVVYAVELAVEYRQKFHKDVWVDMVCYRKHGHNESDEPKFTQPTLYGLISKHPNPREVYWEKLNSAGEVESNLAKTLEKEFKKTLQDRLNNVKQSPLPYTPQPLEEDWNNLSAVPLSFEDNPKTGVDRERLEKGLAALSTYPDGFNPIKKVKKLLEERKTRFSEDKLDWAMGELLAYATLLQEGHNVRISGQDVTRGTFSHRHAMLFDETTNEAYSNLNQITDQQGTFQIYNSHLSEFGVLGFEYGYSSVHPFTLTIWEAQFGDFANGAQVMVDQFISSAESKWQRMSGLVMMLPHGYEGEGPEHSNARPERYLQLCAENNMIVANITEPANYFHLLRRQLTWSFRKPLVVFTPKSILRHPKAISKVEALTGETHFKPILFDDSLPANKVKRVLMCSGKLYYDLLEKKEQDGRDDVALLRLEQLYPLAENQLNAIYSKYAKADFFWVQEEPKNMGAWTFLLRYEHAKPLTLIARKASASPATGFKKEHFKEQEEIVNQAFA